MKVAIVGSGSSARRLRRAPQEGKGIDFTIFEKEGSPGGKLITERVDDFLIEGGPGQFSSRKTLDRRSHKGGRSERSAPADQRPATKVPTSYSGGRLHRLPEGVMLMVPTMIMPLVKSRLISWPGKIRMGMELFVPGRKDDEDESLARFVTRRLGRECLEKIAEPLVAGIHTSNPDNMSVKAIFPRFLDMERKHGSLIRGMTAAMGKGRPQGKEESKMTYFMSLKGGHAGPGGWMPRLHRSTECGRGERGQGDIQERRGIWTSGRLRTDELRRDRPDRPFLCRASGMIRSIDPMLSEQLSAIEWSSTATISLAFRKDEVPPRLPGFGFLVPRIEKRRINAATWSSIKWSHRAPSDRVLVRCFVGGGHDEETVSYDDKDLLKLVREELCAIAGIRAKPVITRVFRWMKSMPRYTVGHIDRVASIDERLAALPGLYLIGSSYRGIGIGDCVKSGFDAASEIASFARS